MDLPDPKPDIDNGKIIWCSVQNCRKIIEEGKGIKIGNKVYCPQCGAQLIKQSFLGI